MYDVVGTWGAYGEDGLPGGYQLCVELLQPTASSPLAWVRVPDLPPLVEGTGSPGDETRQDAVQAPCAQVFRTAQPIFGARIRVRTWFTAASGGTLALDLLHAEFMLPSAPRVTSMPRSDVNLHGTCDSGHRRHEFDLDTAIDTGPVASTRTQAQKRPSFRWMRVEGGPTELVLAHLHLFTLARVQLPDYFCVGVQRRDYPERSGCSAWAEHEVV
jgi:hypothetical protein